MPRHPGRTALYRLFDMTGRLLYVGVAHNPDQRWATHSLSKAWWPQVDKRLVEWHATRSGAERAELAAIRQEGPLHNVAGTPAARVSPAIGKTPTRPIRVDLDEWGIFGEATNAQGTDRSAAFRAFMNWYLHKPGSKAPSRPTKAEVEQARTEYLRKEAAKAIKEGQ